MFTDPARFPCYKVCFKDIFDSEHLLWVPKHIGSAAEILQAGVEGLDRRLKEANVRSHRPTLNKIVAWARSAPSAEEPVSLHRRFFTEFDAVRRAKLRLIEAVESDLVEPLSQTPYVLLVSIPGINVVSAAEFAGEMGPVQHYPKPRAITGRAGLWPSRHQSDQVDHPNGPLVRRANHDLRRAILMVADNMIRCNEHLGVLVAGWRKKNADARDIRVRVGSRSCRIAFHVVSGRMTFRHPCTRQRDYVLKKLLHFALEHAIASDQLVRNLDAATARVLAQRKRDERIADARATFHQPSLLLRRSDRYPES